MAILKVLVITIMGFSAVKKTSEIPDKREFPVNTSIEPCTDFYQYTCSKVIDSFKLREDRSRHIFSFSDSSERLLESKTEYLQSLARQPKKTKGEKELSDLFVACLNVDQRAIDEKKTVTDLITTVDQIKEREEFLKFLGDRVGTEDYTFFDFGTVRNQKKPNIYDTYIIANVRGLPETSYYKDEKVLRAYKELLKNFFKTLGFKNAEQRAEWVKDFELGFDKTYPKPAEWRELWTQKSFITKGELKKNFPEFKLDSFLKKVPNRTMIRDWTPETYKYLQTKLKSENLEKLKSVFLFHALSDKMDQAYKNYFNDKFVFQKTYLGGPNKRRALKERCTNYVKGRFSKELDYELYPKLFGDFSEKKFLNLVKKVRDSLISGIENNTWLSSKGKKNAKKKMQKAFLQVVKPRNKKEWDFVDPADYSPRYHLANIKLRSKMANKKSIRELGEKISDKTWGYGPLMVNAYYQPTVNKFVMPVGILQYPFYDQTLPDHQNLGAIGMVIGHELGHGIDDSGSKFDHKGRLNQWMSEKDIKEFQARGAQLISQFEEIGHDGKLTLGENIGDLVGLTAAYNAAFPKGEGRTEDKQEFFVQYGRSWCGVMRPGERKRLLKTDSHSLVEARVNEQVKHQPGFVEAFSCKAGDKMYLPKEKRVTIW